MAERELLLGLATEIVSAHVRNNTVPPDQLPTLIQQVFNTLSIVEQACAASPRPQPFERSNIVQADQAPTMSSGRR